MVKTKHEYLEFLIAIIMTTLTAIKSTVPVISNLPTSVSVGERETGNRLIYTLSVTDGDSDSFVCDVLSTNPANGPFTVTKDPSTNEYGVYTQSPSFNFGTASTHTVNVQCNDTNGDAVTEALSVDIINNDRLRFRRTPYKTTQDASAVTINTVLFTPTTEDMLGHTPLSLSMTTSPASNSFSINSANGAISAAQDLKYETNTPITVYITVTDGYIEVTEPLIITLTNMNNLPSISNLIVNGVTSTYQLENLASGSTLFTNTIYDPDASQTQTVTFNTVPTGQESVFTLTSNVLSLATNTTFDYESVSSYRIAFYVSDTIATTGPYYLDINIQDVGEVCSFDKTVYETSPYEGPIGSGTIDLNFALSDGDNSDTHTFSLISDATSALFQIDGTTGVITYKVHYDYDVSHQKNVTIIVKCTDSYGLTGTATVSVFVKDVNDNAPDFNVGGYVLSVSQYNMPGYTIGSVTATDIDSGNNAEITYTGTSVTGSNYYNVAKNGEVYLTKAIDFDYGTTHRFSIVAVDNGSPQLTGTTTLDIVYYEATTTTTTTTIATPVNDSDFWSEPGNIALVAILSALLLLGLLTLLWCLLKKASFGKPTCCRRSTKVKQPNRNVTKPKNPKGDPFDFWKDDELSIKRQPFVSTRNDETLPVAMIL